MINFNAIFDRFNINKNRYGKEKVGKAKRGIKQEARKI